MFMCITTSSYAMVMAESSPKPTEEVPLWVSLAKAAPLTAYWGNGEYIFAVGSAMETSDIPNQEFAALYMAAENSVRAKGFKEGADVRNIQIGGVWKDPATGILFVLIRVHWNDIVEVPAEKTKPTSPQKEPL